MPGRYEALEIFEEEAAAADVTHLLCLVSDEEIYHKSPDYLSAIENEEIMQVLWRVEIEDYGRPGNLMELEFALDMIRNSCLERGESVVIHCGAGHGRTGMVAILLLMRMGFSLDDAEELIRIAGSAPDTAGQRDFLQEQEITYLLG